jgi:hypothetical protein
MSDPVDMIAKTIYDRLHAIGIPIRDHVALGIARTALSALEGEGLVVGKGWQPIETVPKDDTKVLMTDGDRQWVGWTDDGEFWSVETTWPISEDSNREATHWMPLPPPPVTESTSEELGHE